MERTLSASKQKGKIQFGRYVTTDKMLTRVIPSPFGASKRPELVSECAAKDIPRTPLSTATLHFGTFVRPASRFCGRPDLSGWTSPGEPESVVPLRRVVKRAASRATSQWTVSPAPQGLANGANECFANAVLQLLLHCAPLRQWLVFLNAVREESLLRGMIVDSFPDVLDALVRAAVAYGEPVPSGKQPVTAWSPFAEPLPALPLASQIVPVVMPGRQTALEQQDAQEFLFLLLDALHRALLEAETLTFAVRGNGSFYDDSEYAPEEDKADAAVRQRNGRGRDPVFDHYVSGQVHDDGDENEETHDAEAWTEVGAAQKKSVVLTKQREHPHTIVSRLLRGRLRSTLKRRGNKPSISIEPFFALSVEPKSDGGTDSCTIETLLSTYIGAERVDSASKETFLEELPPTLFVHVARFAYTKGVGTVKMHTNVVFGSHLEFPPSLFSAHASPASPLRYTLRGVVRHHGMNATSGHYTACVSVQVPAVKGTAAHEAWFLCNDEVVDRMTEAQVLDTLSQRSCYLLMYSRD